MAYDAFTECKPKDLVQSIFGLKNLGCVYVREFGPVLLVKKFHELTHKILINLMDEGATGSMVAVPIQDDCESSSHKPQTFSLFEFRYLSRTSVFFPRTTHTPSLSTRSPRHYP